MPKFRYTAADSHGQTVSGELFAADTSSAERQLRSRGLTSIELTPTENVAAPARLTDREAEQVVVALAEVSDSQLPLAAGLRAAAMECSNRRVAAALRHIAADIESGFAVESIMTERGKYLPAHVRGLVVAGARTNRLGSVLDQLVEHHLAIRETGRQIMASLAYPCLVLIGTLIFLVLMPFFIVPQFKTIFLEFELELPAATQALISLSDFARWLAVGSGKWLLLIVFVVAMASCLAGRWMLGSDWTHVVAASIPLLGPMWQWSAAAAFLRLLAILLDHGIPLPEALQLVGDGVPSPTMRGVARSLAEGAHQGRSLAEMVSSGRHLPVSILPFIHWGEKSGQLPEALRTMNQMLLTRIRVRTFVLKAIGPPVVFIITAVILGFVVLALFTPLVSLIQSLS